MSVSRLLRSIVHGGIVGRNEGIVTRALYIAVAPSSTDPATNYPITGSGTAGVECYYLTGTNYKLSSDASWSDSALNDGTYAGGGTGETTEWFISAVLSTSYGSDWSSTWQIVTDYPYPLPISAVITPDIYLQSETQQSTPTSPGV